MISFSLFSLNEINKQQQFICIYSMWLRDNRDDTGLLNSSTLLRQGEKFVFSSSSHIIERMHVRNLTCILYSLQSTKNIFSKCNSGH